MISQKTRVQIFLMVWFSPRDERWMVVIVERTSNSLCALLSGEKCSGDDEKSLSCLSASWCVEARVENQPAQKRLYAKVHSSQWSGSL
jgi:hypothetical protein